MARCEKSNLKAIADGVEEKARALSSLRRAMRHLRREVRLLVRELGAWGLFIVALFASAITQCVMRHWN